MLSLKQNENLSWRKNIIITGLAAVIIISGVYSFREYFILYRFNLISSYRNNISAILAKNHAPLSAENVNLIDTWMTFNYINIIFKLPADYLKTNLNILDKRYPNVSLNGFIKNNKLNKATFLESVRQAVSLYLINKK